MLSLARQKVDMLPEGFSAAAPMGAKDSQIAFPTNPSYLLRLALHGPAGIMLRLSRIDCRLAI